MSFISGVTEWDRGRYYLKPTALFKDAPLGATGIVWAFVNCLRGVTMTVRGNFGSGAMVRVYVSNAPLTDPPTQANEALWGDPVTGPQAIDLDKGYGWVGAEFVDSGSSGFGFASAYIGGAEQPT